MAERDATSPQLKPPTEVHKPRAPATTLPFGHPIPPRALAGKPPALPATEAATPKPPPVVAPAPSPSPPDVTRAAPPAPSSAEPLTAPLTDADREEVRAMVRVGVDEAVAVARIWQREGNTRMDRLEAEVEGLRRLVRELRAAPAMATVVAPVAAQAVAPAPVAQAAAPSPLVASPAPLSIPVSVSPPAPAEDLRRLAFEPVDYGALPDMLDGRRRRRTLAWIVALVLVAIVGGLIVLATLSQTRGGL